MRKRSKFTGSFGFVLAAAGSAVGLGNIWRFPYLAAKYGGGIFLLVYLLLTVSFGFSLMITEISIGRKTGLSPIGAFRALHKKYAFLGVIAVLVSVIILPYYSVIGGWVIRYFTTYLTNSVVFSTSGNFFDTMLDNGWSMLLCTFIFIALTTFVILKGVKHGIERVSKILMPLLLLLTLIITVYSLFLPGAIEGVKYFLIPNFSHFSVQTILAALGQMFYSLSLAMGIMITYGSYLRKEDDLEKAVGRIEIFDSGIAFLAGLMIIPAVFSFSHGDPDALSAGPGLMFVTLPKVFSSMGMSGFIGTLFFLLVLFAALTSAISMMESIVAAVRDQTGLKRSSASLLVAGVTLLLSLPPILGYNLWSDVQLFGFDILTFMDFVTNSVLMPVFALLTCIFIGYVIGTNTISDEVKISSSFRREKVFQIMIRYIAPVFILAILVSSILDAIGIIKF